MFDGLEPILPRIYHGDYKKMLDHLFLIALIFTSPPYNIGTKGPRVDGNRKNGLYDSRSCAGPYGYADSLPEDVYQAQQIAFLMWCAERLAPNGTLVYNHKLRRRNKEIISPLDWIRRVPSLVLAEEIVWDRGSGHNHDKTQMWSQTERLYVMYRRDGEYRLDDNLKSSDIPQHTDVWRIGRAGKTGHCAAFPEELAEAVIKTWSKPGELVVDPYSGSGTSAVVAARIGRRFAGSEIKEEYYNIALGRLVA